VMGKTSHTFRTSPIPFWKCSRSLVVRRFLKSRREVSRIPREQWSLNSAASARSIESMLSGTADVWARLWPEGDPKEVDDNGRLLEEIVSSLARDGDSRRRASAWGRASVAASTGGAALGTCVRGRCRRVMIPENKETMMS